jgi:hypothetical protein
MEPEGARNSAIEWLSMMLYGWTGFYRIASAHVNTLLTGHVIANRRNNIVDDVLRDFHTASMRSDENEVVVIIVILGKHWEK